MRPKWTLNNGVNIEDLGLIPFFLDDTDPRSATEQFASNYVGGWSPFGKDKWEICYTTIGDLRLCYDGDESYWPVAKCVLHGDLIVLFDHAWVAIIKPNHSFEVTRMD